MANKQIYELNNAGNDLDNSALLAMDIPNPDSSAASEIPYVTRKASINVLENQFLGEDEYTTELNTENQTIFGSINEVLTYAKNIAEEYDDTATYAVGDFVTYMGVLYKCIVAIAVAESWDSTHWDSTLIVEEFGSGGGGASVTLGTTPPSDASGSNGDLYVQYDGVSYAAVFAYVKINNSWRKFPYSKVVALTQAEYDLITPDPTTLYIITDAQSSYQTKTDNSLATTDKTVVGAINELNTDKQDIIPNTVAKTVTFDVANDGGDVKAKVYNRVLYVSGYFRFSSNQAANTQLLHISDVTLAMEYYESCYTDGSSTVRFKLTSDGKLINENQFQANQWVSISLACLLA